MDSKTITPTRNPRANGLIRKAAMVSALATPLLFEIQVSSDEIQTQRHVSYAAPLLAILFVASIWMWVVHRHKMSPTVRACLAVAAAYFVSGIVNGTLATGTVLSQLQTWLADAIVCYVVTAACRKTEDRAFLRTVASLFAIGFLIYWAFQISSAFHASLFNGMRILGAGANWNVIGIGYVVICAFLITGVLEEKSTPLTMLGIGACVIAIMLSFSRSAYIAFAIVLCGTACATGFQKFRKPLLAIAPLLALAYGAQWWATQAFPGSQEFMSEKISRTGTEVVDLRLKQLTIEPIMNWLGSDPIRFVFGDGASFQHSVLSHSLVMAGLVGFCATLFLYYQVVSRSLLFLLNGSKNRWRWVLVALTVGMFLQDCAGNAINMSGFASLLFLIIIGALEPPMRRPELSKATHLVGIGKECVQTANQ